MTMSGAKKNRFKFTARKPDRLLGDQWSDWSGELDGEGSLTSARLFFFLSVGVLALGVAFSLFVLYMVTPRLAQYHYRLPEIVLWLVGVGSLLGCLWFLVLSYSCWLERRLMPGRRGHLYFLRYLLDRSMGVASFLGIHRDSVGHSFVRFTNRLTRADRVSGRLRLMVLLPRCLLPEQRKEIEEEGKKEGVSVFIATGGGSARQIIAELRPQAIIAVACERDLVAGIKDVAPRLPVLAVPNIRPEGPCKNTRVDVDLVRSYIRFFLGG